MSKIAIGIMVKNESSIIERCLQSVIPIADLVVITDTGSTDDTIIKAGFFLQNRQIPFKIYHETFIDFSHNRNLVLNRIIREKGVNYILLLDADEVLEYPEGINLDIFKTSLIDDYYNIIIKSFSSSYYLPRLTKNIEGFRYKGATHEFLDNTGFCCGQLKKSPIISQINDSSRRKLNNKFKEDISILKNALSNPALKDNPDMERRYTFYLAQTYRDLRVNDLAYEFYDKRFKLGGWKEEMGYSQYQMGRILNNLNRDPWKMVNHYMLAYEYMPNRIEPLVYLREYFKSIQLIEIAEIINKKISLVPKPDSGLFLEEEIYARR